MPGNFASSGSRRAQIDLHDHRRRRYVVHYRHITRFGQIDLNSIDVADALQEVEGFAQQAAVQIRRAP